MSALASALAPDVAFRPDGPIEPIAVTAWLTGIEQAVSTRLSLSGYFSGTTIARTAFVDTDGSFIGFGHPGATRELVAVRQAAHAEVTRATPPDTFSLPAGSYWQPSATAPASRVRRHRQTAADRHWSA